MEWFKLKKPKSPDEQFKGLTLTCFSTYQDAKNRTNGEKLKVEHIAGNLTHQTMFQINGSHLVSMLDAYCELNKEPLPDMEMHQDFLSTVAEVVHSPGEQKALEANPESIWAGEVGKALDYDIKTGAFTEVKGG